MDAVRYSYARCFFSCHLVNVLVLGKTSLLNLLIGEQVPTEGSVHRHVGSRIAMLQQHHYKGEQLDPDLSPLVQFLLKHM
jgi:ATPase subunit of ABC transporter with duplicated ATPase domains